MMWDPDQDNPPVADAVAIYWCPTCEVELIPAPSGWRCPECWASWDRTGRMGLRWVPGNPGW